MFSSSCRMFSRSASTFLKLNCNKLRLLSRSFYQSQAYQLPSAFNRQSSSNDFNGKHNKKLRETNDSFEGILERIELLPKRIEDENSKAFISSAINIILAYTIEKKKLPKYIQSKEFDQLLKSKEFIKFFAVVQDRLSELPLEDLLQLFRLLSFLNVPFDSRFEDVTSRLIENQSLLSFAQRCGLYQTLYNCGNSRMMGESKKLEKDLVKNLKEKVYVRSLRSTLLALMFVQHNFVPDDLRAQVLEYVVGLSRWDSFIIFKRFLSSLVNLSSTHPKYSSIKNLYFEKVKTHCCKDGRFSCEFLISYGKMVKDEEMEYCDKLIDDIVHASLQFTPNSFAMKKIGLALEVSNHVNYKYLEYASNLIQSNCSSLIENPDFYAKIIALLAKSNHNHENRCRWSGILPFIMDSPALSNTLRIYEEGKVMLADYIMLMTQLASLGIYIDGSLRFLSRRINECPEIITEMWDRRYFFSFVAGILNESVRVLRPSFSENFLDDNALSFIINQMKEYKNEPSSTQDFLLDLQSCLDSVSETKNSILLMCSTRGGLFVDGIVAMNDKAELYSFTSLFEKKDIIFLEDITVPNNFKLIALIFATKNSYTRNTHSLNSCISQRLNVLEAMGYPSIYILEDTWDELDDKDKGQYLFDLICKKWRNEMLSAPSGIPLEPVDHPTAW